MGWFKRAIKEIADSGLFQAPTPPPPPPPPSYQDFTYEKINKWLGFDHFPCPKCQAYINQPQARIYIMLGQPPNELMLAEDYFNLGASPEFKNQFLLLHP